MSMLPSEKGSLLLQARGLSKTFGGMRIIDGVNLDLYSRGIKVIIGPNGAGKSTLFRLISGTLRHDSGSIILDGVDIASYATHERQQLGIAQSFQVPKLAKGLTVGEHFHLSSSRRVSMSRTLLKRGALPQESPNIQRVLGSLCLRANASAWMHELSHADRKKLDLCCAFLQTPRLLLLDEPTAGLNSREIPAVRESILQLETETSILLIEHDMKFVRSLDREVVVLHQGRIIRSGDLRSLEEDGFIREIYFGRQRPHS